jgi:predicted SAM-dependent methyltransferase
VPFDRIHYGCGDRVLDGWVNVDLFDESYPFGIVDLDKRKRIVHADLAARHPFPDHSFQWGYSEDFLEHLTQAESLIFLCEAYRTLKPGGVLRLSFPSLPGVLRRHLRSSDYQGGATCRQEAYVHWYHEHFYSFESLETVARHIGFREVRRCDYGISRFPELLQESREQQADLNLVVELTK